MKTHLKRQKCEQLNGGLMLVGQHRYFVYTARTGRRWLVRADCPHRGGPLHLARYDVERNALQCPWHKMYLPERALINRSAPAVRVLSEWTAVVPESTHDHTSSEISTGCAIAACGGCAASRATAVRRQQGQSMAITDRYSSLLLLKNRRFSIYLGGQLISYTFTWVQVIAMSWVVLQVTGSPLAVGGVTAVATLPALFVSPVAGAFGDRIRKRNALMFIQVGRASASLLFGAAVFEDTGIATFLALAFMIGVLTAIDTPVRQAFMYELGGKKHVADAVILNELTFNIGRVLGGPICGLVITTLGPTTCFMLNAGGYFIVLSALTIIPDEANTVREAVSRPAGIFGDLRIILSDRRMRLLFASLAIYSVSTLNHVQIFTMYVKLSLEADAATLGQLIGWLGAGALVSAIALVGMNLRSTPALYLSATVLPACFLMLAATTSITIVNFIGCLFGAALVQYLVRMSVLLQTIGADEKRGSVTGLYSMCLVGATPISVMLSGALSQYLDANTALRTGGGLAAIGFLLLLRAAPASGLYAVNQEPAQEHADA